MDTLFGPTLLQGAEEKPTGDILAGKVVLVYFSAQWCLPSDPTNAQLADFWRRHASKKGFEIVFASSDRDAAAFDAHRAAMPFAAVPYSDRGRRDELARRWGVQRLPAIVVVDAEGELVTRNGRQHVMVDFDACAGFPWRPRHDPKEPLDFLQGLGPQLLKKGPEGPGLWQRDGSILRNDATGGTAERGGKKLGIYFGSENAEGKELTVQIRSFYETYQRLDPDFEMIYCPAVIADLGSSADQVSRQHFNLDHGDYLMVPPSHDKGREALMRHFGVKSVPCVSIADASGGIINKDATAMVAGGKKAAAAVAAGGWDPPLVGDLAEGRGALGWDISDTKAVLVCIHGQGAVHDYTAAHRALIPLAREYKEKAARGAPPDVIFLVSRAAGGVLDQLCELTKGGGPRCAAPCADGRPLVLLFNIPGNGTFHVSQATDVTTDGIRAFLRGPGPSYQLSR